MQHKDHRICSICLHAHDRIPIQDGFKLLAASESVPENVLEGPSQVENTRYYFDQEMDRGRARPNHQWLNSMVITHVDLMNRYATSKPRLKGFGQEYWSRVTGRRVSVEEKWENVFPVQQQDSVTEPIVDIKHSRRLLLRKHRHRVTEENLRKVSAIGDGVFQAMQISACSSM